jgi:hypothetical protein
MDPAKVDLSNGDAPTLLEVVVEAAARSAEERKCEVIPNLYSAVLFDPETTVADTLLYLQRINTCPSDNS